ncbi:hypothetical protein HMI56_004965 [Coelomomyces lativittatus]|nr:hypothetical protein HMI56_004965 [Coelomomyces lativittatus]
MNRPRGSGVPAIAKESNEPSPYNTVPLQGIQNVEAKAMDNVKKTLVKAKWT